MRNEKTGEKIREGTGLVVHFTQPPPTMLAYNMAANSCPGCSTSDPASR